MDGLLVLYWYLWRQTFFEAFSEGEMYGMGFPRAFKACSSFERLEACKF